LKNIQVVRDKMEGKFKFTREINCCDLIIILILTWLNVICHLVCATNEWVTLPELQMLTPEHSVRNKVTSQHFSKIASYKMTVFFTYWYQGVPCGLSWLYWPSNLRLSAKLVPAFADRGCYMISTMDHYGRILGFLDRSCYLFFQVAPQLYTRGWVDPVPDPLLLRKSGSARNLIRVLWICSQELLTTRPQKQSISRDSYLKFYKMSVNLWLTNVSETLDMFKRREQEMKVNLEHMRNFR
jgi:hypothetical protein